MHLPLPSATKYLGSIQVPVLKGRTPSLWLQILPQQHVIEQGANCSKQSRWLDPGVTWGGEGCVLLRLSICLYSAHLLSCSWVPFIADFSPLFCSTGQQRSEMCCALL